MRIRRMPAGFDGAVIKQRRHSTEAVVIRWAFGCGLPVIIALGFVTVELHLVARADVYCAGDCSRVVR
ncbi:hypothetical protein ACIBIZ_45335 [Nonomuraea spiralis]|uniref:hypothetical protein n=1 Tax=Nonomuraea spiralis TaxID=46182 RepID=UPI0037995305